MVVGRKAACLCAESCGLEKVVLSIIEAIEVGMRTLLLSTPTDGRTGKDVVLRSSELGRRKDVWWNERRVTKWEMRSLQTIEAVGGSQLFSTPPLNDVPFLYHIVAVSSSTWITQAFQLG